MDEPRTEPRKRQGRISGENGGGYREMFRLGTRFESGVKMANQQNRPNPTQVQKFLGGMNYPADKNQVIEHAKGKKAPEDIIEMLKKLADRKYEGPTGIIDELY